MQGNNSGGSKHPPAHVIIILTYFPMYSLTQKMSMNMQMKKTSTRQVAPLVQFQLLMTLMKDLFSLKMFISAPL